MGEHSGADQVAVALGWAALAALTYLVYLVVAPFVTAFGWAAVFAIVIHPLHARLARRWGTTRAAAASTLAVTALLVAPALVVMTVFAGEAVDAVSGAQRALIDGRLGWIERAWAGLQQRIPGLQELDLAAVAGDAAGRGAAYAVAQSGLVLRDLAALIFDLGVSLFATFFLLRDSEAVVHAVRRLLPLHEGIREELIARTVELVSAGVVATGIVAAAQGALGGLVFWAVGLDNPVFWGVVMALLCVLPFGAGVVWLPAAVWLATSGEVTRALVLAALGLVIVSGADNILRPILVSGRAHMNGLVILVGLLGGMSVLGPLGLVLGPILMATALALLTAYVDAPAHDGWRA